MSDTGSMEQVRDRVLQLAREIEKLSQSTLPPQEFFPEFLQRLLAALGAPAGALWLRENGGRLRLECGIRFAQTGAQDDPQARMRNDQLLSEVIATGQASIYSPDDASDAQLPSHHLIILGALQHGSDCVGAVEIFQRADAPREAHPGYLQFVEQMCGYASQYLARRGEMSAPEPAEQFWEQFDRFLLQLERGRNVSEVGAVVVNDARLLLRCDRLSLAVRRGSRTFIAAISGQESVNSRANLVRSMVDVASAAMALRESVQYTGQVGELAPQVEKPLAEFIQQSGSRMAMILPLFEREPFVVGDEQKDARRQLESQPRVIGALLVEQSSRSRPAPELSERVDLLADHVAAALSGALEYQRVFLLPLWRFLGRVGEWFYGRKLAKAAAVFAAVLALCLTLVLVPWDYHVEGEGRLMPVAQREVFAPWDGEVMEIFVEGGNRVQQGEPLVRLRNDELRAQLLSTRNELTEKQQLEAALRAQIDDAIRTADRDEEIRLEAKLVETRIEIEGLEEQVRLLEGREAALTVKAPMTGVVATFQPEQLLRNRPVRRGDTLLEVMNPSGAWHLELEVEEHRIGHILRGRERLGTDRLPVEFVLATSAESTFSGQLKAIATRSATSEQLGSVVEIFVATNADRLPSPRIGAEVRAKINCGRRSLGYVLFGDVIEFAQRHLWL